MLQDVVGELLVRFERLSTVGAQIRPLASVKPAMVDQVWLLTLKFIKFLNLQKKKQQSDYQPSG